MIEPVSVSAESLPRPRASQIRIVLNRFLFRGMLFSTGIVAVALYKLFPDKGIAWRFAKASARALARLCGVRVRVRGLEHLGDGPYIFTPNHQSHFDIAALLGHLPGNNRFAAKKELFREPVLGTVLRTLGMIPIDRDNPADAIERLNHLNGAPASTIVFPEGTRSRNGQLLEFKKGPFVAAIQLGIPIVPVACKGTRAVMPPGGYLSILPGEVEIVLLKPIATSTFCYEDRERLRDEVSKRIGKELGFQKAKLKENGSVST